MPCFIIDIIGAPLCRCVYLPRTAACTARGQVIVLALLHLNESESYVVFQPKCMVCISLTWRGGGGASDPEMLYPTLIF